MWSQDSERVVSREEGIALAKELGCLFLECSAKTRENVEQCFEELALKVILLPLKAVSLSIYFIVKCMVGFMLDLFQAMMRERERELWL